MRDLFRQKQHYQPSQIYQHWKQ